MPRYYFHVYNDEQTYDEEGMELLDTMAALTRARCEARILAAESIKEFGHLIMGHRIEVSDESGRKILTVRFSDVVDVQG
jgi:hypothetical protein